jgi:DNA-binding NtrC family response regulator
VPEELQLGELFGWKKGAFTGAAKDNEGYLARAEGGTLFIDEIDKLSLKAQAGLLHVLEERSYRSLGASGGERPADVRFVIGTNADLRAAVKDGTFREDLFYRINVLPVRLPPLAERRDEIAPWARFMIDRRHKTAGGAGEVRLEPESEALLAAEPWPGNLRQLDNILRRAYTLALMDGRAPGQDLVIGREHVTRALAYERGERQQASLVALLDAAAAALAAEAEKRKGGEPLDLDLADAFRGFALAAATIKAGSKEDALRLFGREALVQSRNHHKLFRREMERVALLCKTLGVDLPASFSRLSDEG